MKHLKKMLLGIILGLFVGNSIMMVSPVFAADGDGGEGGDAIQTSNISEGNAYVLEKVTGGLLGQQLRADDPGNKGGADSVNTWIIDMIGYLIDIFIVIGIAIAFIGGYKIMTSGKEDGYKQGLTYVIFGVVGIIIMVSAKWIANTLVGTGGIISGDFLDPQSRGLDGLNIAEQIYTKLVYPLLKIVLYLIVGALFVVMAIKVFSFVISTDDVAKKKSLGMIARTAIGIFIILGSKQIVESVIGTHDQVFVDNAVEISDIGEKVLKFNSITLVSEIINWVMGLTMLVVLILIILQTYRMLFKPDDSKNTERIKKTLLYVIIGVLVIGASYVISNVLIVE